MDDTAYLTELLYLERLDLLGIVPESIKLAIDFASDSPCPLDKAGTDRRGDLMIFNAYLLQHNPVKPA